MIRFLCGAILTTLGVGSLAQSNELEEFSAYYQANTNGMRGSAERHLVRQDDDHFRLNISLEARMAAINIGDLEQVSEFSISDGIIVPHNYSYMVTGITSTSEAVSFNWDADLALSIEDDQRWELELESGVLDQLSYQVALALKLKQDSAEDFEFRLVDRDKIETHRYRVVGEEILQTPLGALNTTKLERVREEDNGRQTLIWLADDWDYLLARIEQSNPSGLRIELELENALVAGKQVTALAN